MTISSKDNLTVKTWRLLSSDGRARRRQGKFACEGARLCRDAAQSGLAVHAVLYTEKAEKTYGSLLQPVLSIAKSAYIITPALADYLSDTAAPQGIFCICGIPEHTLSPDALRPGGRYLALEDMQDPANLGAVIRTAEALGIHGVLLSDGCCDLYSPKVLRSSMGGVFRLPLLAAGNLADAVSRWRRAGLRCFACVPDRTALPLTAARLSDGGVCLIGNEGNGLKPETADACTARVTIPMDGRAESLNAAAAAAIALWEMTRPTEG